jgi:outer membrane protein assembly factor BamA
LGSTFSFTGINVDVRTYTPINKRSVLAMQAIGNFYKGEVPFNQLALMGGENMMRGYLLRTLPR